MSRPTGLADLFPSCIPRSSRPQLCLTPPAVLCVLLALTPPAAAQKRAPQAIPDSDCMTCHSQPDLKSSRGTSVFVEEARHKASMHSVLSCTDCHTNIREIPHAPVAIK